MPLPLTRKAPAKINPVLEVLGKRPDGYHELSLLFQTIDLHDLLTFEPLAEGLRFECPGAPEGIGPDGSNLVLKAAEIFLGKYPQKKGVLIRLTKNIPVAAGLGGGSSDAASTLLGLDQMFETGLGPEGLREMAERLGSDVPFFLRGGTALGTGRGEKITPLPSMPGIDLVLVKPEQGLPTPAVYGSGKARFTGGECTRQFLELSREKGLSYLAGSLFNGLEPATFALLPETWNIKRWLLEMGALGALVCGSGPTVFGIARSPDHARSIAEKLRLPGRRVFVTRTIA